MGTNILFPLPFKRQFAGPLDVDSVVQTLIERDALLTSPRRYAGMIVSCVETETIYILNSLKDTWLEISTGGGGGQGTYLIFEFTTPSMNWGITHNLGYFPNVTLLDEDDCEMDSYVKHNDVNSVTIEHNLNMTGKVVLR